MANSKIEWTEKTWNPITGCTKISEGCKHCYAERMSKRLAGRCGYDKDEPFKVTLHPDKFDDPLRWKKPSKIFVCSMGDLFHDDVPIKTIIDVLSIIAEASWHTFLFLTKRPERMKEILTHETIAADVWLQTTTGLSADKPTWPLPNLWLGVTAENQQRAEERIPILLDIPAAKRIVSIEPMLGPVRFKTEKEMHEEAAGMGLEDMFFSFNNINPNGIGVDWVICGGETGPGARPMHPDWVRSLRDQCVRAGTPFFFKSWGEYEYLRRGASDGDGKYFYNHVGKKHSGHLLDGEEWNEYPKEG